LIRMTEARKRARAQVRGLVLLSLQPPCVRADPLTVSFSDRSAPALQRRI
jgi:hypothetical protein